MFSFPHFISLFNWILWLVFLILSFLYINFPSFTSPMFHNTQLLVGYFLFWLSKWYISHHIIVVPVLLWIIIVPYNCTYYTATLHDLSLPHFNPEHYYCCGWLYSLSHNIYFLYFNLTISHHLTLHKCSVFWIQLTIILPSNKSLISLSPFIKVANWVKHHS